MQKILSVNWQWLRKQSNGSANEERTLMPAHRFKRCYMTICDINLPRIGLLQLYLVLFSFSEEIVDDCPASSDHDSYKGHQSDSEQEAAENKLNKFKFTDGNQDSKETDPILTKPKSGTYHDKDIPTVEVSSLSLSSSAAHDKHESYSDKRHFTSKKDTSKQTFSRDTIVQSVRVVFQEWCTQSTLEYLGFSVKTEAKSSFSDEKEIGGSFLSLN